MEQRWSNIKPVLPTYTGKQLANHIENATDEMDLATRERRKLAHRWSTPMLESQTEGPSIRCWESRSTKPSG
eukprot:scaffold544_cov320-Pavlova_lutheri.AAC.81